MGTMSANTWLNNFQKALGSNKLEMKQTSNSPDKAPSTSNKK
jgi:hypothetical protein